MEQNHQNGQEDAQQQPQPRPAYRHLPTHLRRSQSITAGCSSSSQVCSQLVKRQSPDYDGGNSWDRERCSYERGLKVQTNLLLNRLTDQINNNNRNGAIHIEEDPGSRSRTPSSPSLWLVYIMGRSLQTLMLRIRRRRVGASPVVRK
ncbi:hypothetical protein OUZ56_012344 [Daphnia magna]|uniref:Uncharacterized protein n=1 Tax=Daphnia magna TaxID=35525 RepID=A0ABQ9Z2R2_9CRUS|nr:hypothetical protein OUZ56_012344 [Daphnia magna]